MTRPSEKPGAESLMTSPAGQPLTGLFKKKHHCWGRGGGESPGRALGHWSWLPAAVAARAVSLGRVCSEPFPSMVW